MRNMKKTFVVVLMVVLTLSFSVGCAKKEIVTIATGGEAGTYYPLGVAYSKLLTEKGGMTATAVTTNASIDNINKIKNGEVQVALVQNDVTYYASKGETLFDSKVEGLKGFATLYQETVQIVTPADSGIKTVEDLKGKRVAIGDANSGAEANALQVLEAYGMTKDDIKAENLGFGDAATKMQDGNLDAAFVTAGIPTSAIQQLGSSKKVTIVEISDEARKTLTEKYPYYTEQTVPAGTYNGQDNDVKTVAVMAMLVLSDKVSEDTAYKMAKTLFENLDAMGNAHARGKDIKLETALEGMPIDLHPGVKKYFDEKGVK